jgi:phospholipid-binding lipoprotein MlaA
MTRSAVALVALLTLFLAGCATAPNAKKDPRDPWEGFNRVSYKVTDVVDRGVLRPVARGYHAVAPQFVETGVSNFFENLGQPTIIVNNFLQGKVKDGFSDTGRFLLNTTLGIGGLFDPATHMGLDKHDEDFGQTFGKWGMKPGPYLWLPFWGPSTVRDGIGRGIEAYSTDPLWYVERDAWRYSLQGARIIDWRTKQLSLDQTLDSAFDRYAFIRNAYLQQREYAVHDGNVPPPSLEDQGLEDPDPDADKK